MPVVIVGALLVTICLFWFGWTSRSSVYWIVPIIGSSLFSIAALHLFVSVVLLHTMLFSHQRLTNNWLLLQNDGHPGFHINNMLIILSVQLFVVTSTVRLLS